MPNETAFTASSPQLRPGADAARADSVVSRDHCPAAAAPAVAAASMLPSLSRARVCPDGAAAIASGTSARSASSSPGVQFLPVSLLTASGEKASAWLGRNPTRTDVPPAPPVATSPPLSATPSGVTRDQRLAPAGRTNTCQKLFAEAAEPPMTVTAQVPCAVTSEVDSGAVTACRLGVVLTVAVWVPQPAVRPVRPITPAPSSARTAPRPFL